MVTLTIGNIKWDIQSHEDKAAYLYGKSHAILFNPANNGYSLVETGRVVLWNQNASKCLEASTQVILDYLASQFVPIWAW